MNFGDILVCIDRTDSGGRRTAIALALAGRSRARLIGYYLTPRRGLSVDDFLAAPQTTATENAAQDFDRELKLHNLDGAWVLGNHSHAIEDIANYSRCADLVVAGLGTPDDPHSEDNVVDIEKLVIACGRPVLGIPVTASSEDEIGTNVMIAWDGSREACRALHDALPFLREAATVKVVAIDGDPTAVASPGEAVTHLQRMGIKATVDDQLDLRLPIGEEILSRIDRNEVDLLVAGAFGHSRLKEHVVGGASRSLLHQMMVPVLVSH